MLKLKLQYFGHLMRRTDPLEKTLMLEKIEGRRRRGQQRMRWLNGITDLMDMSLNSRSWWWTGRPELQFMGSRWGNSGSSVRPYFLGGSKITADGDCSHEMKRHLLLGRKAMTKLDRILKSRDITLLTKVHLVKDMVFPVVMYGCESWSIKKAEHWRIDPFELWYWKRLVGVP